MRQTFRILRQLMSSYLSVSLTYRLDFLQSIVASLVWSGLSFTSAYLVTSQAPSVAGLSRSDLLLLTSTYGIIMGTHHWFCTRGFSQFWQTIHKGELEGYLLKPFDTVTLLTLRNIGWGSSIRVLASVFTTWWIIQYYALPVSLANVALFILLSIPAFLLIYAIYTISVTILIWHPYLSNLLELINTGVGTGRYPLAIVRHTPKYLSVWFLPFLLVINIPTLALTGKLNVAWGVSFVIVSLTTWYVSRRFWRYALRFYTSASG